jgi:hypothetical protein
MEIYSITLEIPFAGGERCLIHMIPNGSFERLRSGAMRDEGQVVRLLKDMRYCVRQFLHNRDEQRVVLTLRGADPTRFVRFFPEHVDSNKIDASTQRAFGSMPIKRFPGQRIDEGFGYYFNQNPALIRYSHADVLLQWDGRCPEVDIQYRAQHSR